MPKNESDGNNVRFKNNLAVSYLNLAEVYQKMDKAKDGIRFFFQEAKKLWKELVEGFPDYPGFQNNLVWVNE